MSSYTKDQTELSDDSFSFLGVSGEEAGKNPPLLCGLA